MNQIKNLCLLGKVICIQNLTSENKQKTNVRAFMKNDRLTKKPHRHRYNNEQTRHFRQTLNDKTPDDRDIYVRTNERTTTKKNDIFSKYFN